MQVITSSQGSVPPESKHGRCKITTIADFYLLRLNEETLNAPNGTIWDNANANGILQFATENDLAIRVLTFLESFIKAMRLELRLHSELGIQHITPDISVITQGDRLVGVVEVKKPGPSILEQPTVMGELLDQMLLLEKFYSCGPIIGVITTFSEWRFAWFPEDNDHFCSELSFDSENSQSNFLTPVKAKNDSSTLEEEKKRSPPGTTPSHINPPAYRFLEMEEAALNMGASDDPTMAGLRSYDDRHLYTSGVLNSVDNKDELLQYLYTALLRMTQVRLNYRLSTPGTGRCVFKVQRGDNVGITWCSLPNGIDMNMVMKSSRFPRKNTQYLLAIEDLGRGSSGKAWLMMTTHDNPAICVLKFANKMENALKTELKWWVEIYPEFSKFVEVDCWSGSPALCMPHFPSIPIDKRRDYIESIRHLLESPKFGTRYVHNDVRWRNIGLYKQSDGNVIPVLYDLESVVIYSEEEHMGWIDEAMRKLEQTVE